MKRKSNVAVVVPCFRARQHIDQVLGGIGPEVSRIYVVDDACPERTGHHVEAHNRDPRVSVLYNQTNRGVGGAVIAGYRQALQDRADVVVKLDGDGQMDPRLIPRFVWPILTGDADYVKGNRFFNLEDTAAMPRLRLWGNALLSALAKFSTGYWDVLDPTNGFTAIHARVLRELPLHKVSERFFFESDMLFRLGVARALVVDIPMSARYGPEQSNLRVQRVLSEFLWKHARNYAKRIFYGYFLRDASVATFELVLGLLLFGFGAVFGLEKWVESIRTGVPASSGTVMLAALPTILGFQMLLGFLAYDIRHTARVPLHKRLHDDPPINEDGDLTDDGRPTAQQQA